MGLFASEPSDAGRGAEPGRPDDPHAAQEGLRRRRRRRVAAGLAAALLPALLAAPWSGPLAADPIRIAAFAAPLSRDGPGLLLRDLQKGEDPQLAAIAAIVRAVDPDILLLTDFDYDRDGVALAAFAAEAGDYPHRFALRPNTGLATGIDLDGNGRTGEARDAMGYGRFAGDGGMALLSRYPIATDLVQDYSAMLWADLPGATLPPMPPEVAALQRLSTSGHWVVPVATPAGSLTLLAYAATPPVFDGPEDRNGLRNRDELRLWEVVLEGSFGPVPEDFVVLGNANLDPVDGEGIAPAMAGFLARSDLRDPTPRSAGGLAAADPRHRGDPATDTADWPDDPPGNLRVVYVLPAATLRVVDAGVFWPAPDDPQAALLGDDGLAAGPHRLVWVDVTR